MAIDGAASIDLGPQAGELCDRAVAETARLLGRGSSRVQDAWLRSRAVRRLATHPQILGLLQAAYGREPFAFQTLNFERGTQQPLHSDTVHFNTEPPGLMCGVWIALEDVDPQAGPLIYRPGSHRMPVINMRAVGVNGRPTLDDYQRHYEPGFEAKLKATDLPMKRLLLRKGQAFAWAANLAHGGSAIENPTLTRRSLVVHYYFKDALYYTPRLSDEVAGDLYFRLPFDIKTGWWVWPRRDGRRIRLPARTVLASILARVFKVVPKA